MVLQIKNISIILESSIGQLCVIVHSKINLLRGGRLRVKRKLSSCLRKLTWRLSDQRQKMIPVPCGFPDKCEDKPLIIIDHEKKHVQDFKPFHNERKEEM